MLPVHRFWHWQSSKPIQAAYLEVGIWAAKNQPVIQIFPLTVDIGTEFSQNIICLVNGGHHHCRNFKGQHARGKGRRIPGYSIPARLSPSHRKVGVQLVVNIKVQKADIPVRAVR